MRTIGLVTSARSDLGYYLPLMGAIEEHPGLELKVVATGMHLSPEFGLTVSHIEEAGFSVHERVDSSVGDDTPGGVADTIGRGVAGFSRLFSRWRPDILVVFGDRFDMFPAALAALPFRIPVAHIAGGEVTEGAIDDALRHSLTKLSHLHFVATSEYADRVVQMGEEPWRVEVVGALTLDNLRRMELWSPEETASRFGLESTIPVALVTYHPVTLEYERTSQQIDSLLSALEQSPVQCVFTYPNADTASSEIIAAVDGFCEGRPGASLVKNAGQTGYYSLLSSVSVMVGNSSSGLVEAPSFGLPVVNVGTRQDGRLRAANVIDCDYGQGDIRGAIQQALKPSFRAGLAGIQNPFGDGRAAPRIVERLAAVKAAGLLRKRFVSNAQRPVAVAGSV